MASVVFVAQDFKKFLVHLQSSAPMIHVVHSMQVNLVHNLSKFIDSKLITNEKKNQTVDANSLLKLDITNKKNHIGKYQVGTKALSLLKHVDGLEKKKIIGVMVDFLEECCTYLKIFHLMITSAKKRKMHSSRKSPEKCIIIKYIFLSRCCCKISG